jgi:hypothetical protein
MSTKFQDVEQQSKSLIQRGVNRKEGSIPSTRSTFLTASPACNYSVKSTLQAFLLP